MRRLLPADDDAAALPDYALRHGMVAWMPRLLEERNRFVPAGLQHAQHANVVDGGGHAKQIAGCLG